MDDCPKCRHDTESVAGDTVAPPEPDTHNNYRRIYTAATKEFGAQTFWVCNGCGTSFHWDAGVLPEGNCGGCMVKESRERAMERAIRALSSLDGHHIPSTQTMKDAREAVHGLMRELRGWQVR